MDSGSIENRSFGTVDYVVFGCVILISVVIGIFFAFRDKRHNTSSNFFVGNRQMSSLPVAISFVVTFQSSIMMLGYPAEVYAYGIQYAVHLIGFVVAFLLGALIVVPLIHPLKVTSIYEYYSLRYDTDTVRYVCVLFGALYYTLYMGIVMFGTALALQSTAGLPLWISILIFSSSAIFYTSLGGIKAVIWTDVFQSIVMFAGILSVITKATLSAGGPSSVANISKDRFNFFDFNPDPTVRQSFWSLVLGAVPQYFYCCITQAGVQRIISTPNIRVAKRLLYLATPIYGVVLIIVMLEGIAVFAYFSEKGCDPLASRQISNPNQLIPFTILEMFQSFPGMPGLFIAALAAASLSTLSSGLSGLATVTCVDILMVIKPNLKDNIATNISKLFVVISGLISAGFAFFLFNVKGPLGQIFSALAGAVGGPETGVFLLSVFYRKCRPRAVIFAAFLGLAINLWLVLGQTFSTEIRHTPYLPAGPTDQCLVNSVNVSGPDSIIYQSNTYNISTDNITETFISSETNITVPASDVTEEPKQEISGLGRLYSISYMYFHLIGTIVTMVTGLLGSVLTQPKIPHEVNEKCVLPLSVFVPSFLKRKKSERITTNTKSEESVKMLRDKTSAL